MFKIMLTWTDASKPGGVAQCYMRFAAIPQPGTLLSTLNAPRSGDAPPAIDGQLANGARVTSTTLFALHPDDATPMAHAMCEVEWTR